MNTVHKIKTFSACNFNHVRSPTGFSQRLPIESAKYLCLRVILRWLISLAVSALLGRCIGQDVLRSRPPAYALAASWLWAGIKLAWPQAPLCFPLSFGKKSQGPARSAVYFVRVCSQGNWGDDWRGINSAAWPKAQLHASCWSSLVTWSGTVSALAWTRLSQLL